MIKVWVGCLLIVILGVGNLRSHAQTPTETPTETATPTATPTQEPYAYSTVEASGTPQMTRFDFVVTAGEVQIANLLTWHLYSFWGFSIFALYLYWRRRR